MPQINRKHGIADAPEHERADRRDKMEPLQPEYRNVDERDRKAQGQRRQVESPGTPAQKINQVADERRHAGKGKKNRLQPDEARMRERQSTVP